MLNGDKPPAAPHPLDDSASTAIVPSDTPPAKPRLSVVHLLVWTATSAMMMAVLRVPNSRAQDFQFIDAYTIGFSIYGGIVVGGVLMWIARRCRQMRFPTEPGEWLLVAQGSVVSLFSIGTVLDRLIVDDDWAYIPMWVLIFATGLLPIIFCRQGRVWFVFFLLLFLIYALPLIVVLGKPGLEAIEYFVWAQMLMIGASPLFIATGLATDWWYGVRRGWVHWIGVATAIFFVLFHLALIIVNGGFVIH